MVTVAFPAGGEIFVAAAVETLRWHVAEDLFGPGGHPVRLQLRAGGTVVWADSVAASLDGSYAFAWTVPDLQLTAARLIVSAVDAVGFAGSDTSAVFVVHNSLTATPPGGLPSRDALAQNAPNPFNPRTMLRFDLVADAVVDLAVYDLTGRRVAQLVVGASPAGRHTVAWDGRDRSGRELPSGSYFARLRLGGIGRGDRVVRMTLLK